MAKIRTDDERGTWSPFPTPADRGVQNRGLPVRPDLSTWGTGVKVFRFAKPDGSTYETSFHGEMPSSTAKVWGDYFGHKLLSEVPTRGQTQPTTESRPVEVPAPPLSPPPLVQAKPSPKPSPKRRPVPTVEPAPPEPTKQPRPTPPVPRVKIKDDYGIIDYLREDFLQTTMTESMPLIAEWFGRVGKGLAYVPGLKGVGKAYEAIGQIAGGMQLLYELVHEVKQDEALEKGTKQLVKRTKPVKKIAENLLKKKYPDLPEPARKKLGELLEHAFEKFVSDPAIEKGKKRARELDEGKDLDKTLYDQLKKTLSIAPELR